ncbi:ubiquitin-specific protease ubp1 [Coemansia sp. RSA 1722]|nr:ubiquitin-specific protease ubp1 [Coemansia sp. RSA 486]KAJ2236958.1 ubiquitin-specific protease ubp1 [Coemansia sp. RSA 485]KAJ2605230.1 ubiquitin-specific protease ubp1 [Coemansia sp. RSA 1722]
MLWYHIIGIYLAIVFGVIVVVVVQARHISSLSAYRRRAEGKRSLWVQIWRWLRFVARCGRRRKKRTKPIDDRREERRALRRQLREEAEEWLLEWVERIVELGDDLLDVNFDDEDEEDELLAREEQRSSDDASDGSGSGAEGQGSGDDRQAVYGLVNTGNSCFFNSVLQALASAEYLQNYLTSVLESMDEINDVYNGMLVSMPLTEALWETLTDLNSVVNRDSAFQPFAVMAALGSSRMNDREQQDAQEAFQLISTALSEERQVFTELQTPSLLNSDLATMLVHEEPNKPRILTVPRGLESVGTKGLARVRALMKLASFAGMPAEGQSLTFGRRPVLPNPFAGLTASRLSCAQCGYTEAVRHFAFDNISLSLPLAATCTLDQALREYISLEELSGVQCRKCTLSQTLRELIAEIKIATAWLEKNPSYKIDQYASNGQRSPRSKRQAERAERIWRRAVLNHMDATNGDSSDSDSGSDTDTGDSQEEGRRGSLFSLSRGQQYPINPASQVIDRSHNLPPPLLVNVPAIIARLRADANEVARALRADVQSPLPGITLRKAYSPLSTKQVAFAKLPPCLCLHLSRSAITPDGYIVKNPCHVRFPEYLDFSPYTTNGNLKVEPTKSMIDETLISQGLESAQSTQQTRRTREANEALGQGVSPQTGYRLQAVVVHIGSHSYGHFITYRRKPRAPMRSGINTPRYRSTSAVSLPTFAHAQTPLGPGADKRHDSAEPSLATAPSNITAAATVAAADHNIRRRRIVGGNTSVASSNSNSYDSIDVSSSDYFSSASQITSSRPKRSWKVADAMTAEWYLISDEDVQPASLAEVLNANPYLLIYERIDSSQVVAGYAGTPGIIPSLSNLRNLARRSASAQSPAQQPTVPQPAAPLSTLPPASVVTES